MPDRITILFDEPIGTIRPYLHGHFAEHLGNCVDDGLWVGEDSSIPNIGGIRRDVAEALKKIAPPILRWPGGCHADNYHWRDGIGPPAARPKRLNHWWGHSVEHNGFGTHEFMNLCTHIGAEPYLAGNLGSGSPGEMRDWVEYCNGGYDTDLVKMRMKNGATEPFDVKFWGVGNESWGCGGGFEPEEYATEYKRFATFLNTFTREPTKMDLSLVAVGPPGNDLDWTRRLLKSLGKPKWDWRIHGLSAHYYCWTAGTATQYTVDQWYQLLEQATRVEQLIVEQRAAMDEFDPERKIALILDEWGTWHPPTPGRNKNHLWQQNTIRDALVAAMSLDIFHRHADKIYMANIAQIVNVLQAMILTDLDRMLLTPTYHVFDLYQSHKGGTSLRTVFESEAISFAVGEEKRKVAKLCGSASIKNSVLTLSVVNAHANLPVEATIDLKGRHFGQPSARVLSNADITAHNTFNSPMTVEPRLAPIDLLLIGQQTFPPASITVFTAQLR
jgi:alpha-L-arabinofuranosidase